ncbi:MAG: hypothetical protein Q4D93_02205 [Porphyromonas sp.]|nr:hypothetical protein [Porphyromonas sp.]
MQLPEAFRRDFAQAFGADELERLQEALSSESPVSIRVNPHKLQIRHEPQIQSGTKRVPWCDQGIYLSERPIFGVDPWWHGGGYYVQEPASMAVTLYLQQYDVQPEVTLDLCAAPGGKSTLLRSNLPPTTLLVANEPDTARANVLRENLLRYNSDEVIITNAYPQELRQAGLSADLILVDAPCSGEGMFRKEPAALSNWSIDNIDLCVTRQREILDESWQILRSGGILIYSTCTYNLRENEEQLLYLRSRHDLEVLPLELPSEWGIQPGKEEGVYRFFPHYTASEGLTLFAVRKLGVDRIKESKPSKQKTKGKKRPAELDHLPEQHLAHSTDGTWSYLSPKGRETQRLLEKGRIQILHTGTLLGQEKGRDFIPHHNWAVSPSLSNLLPYPPYHCTPEEALTYLRREALQISAPKGFVLLHYDGLPIGLVKNLGSRANNLYPKELILRNSNLTTQDLPSHSTLIRLQK